MGHWLGLAHVYKMFRCFAYLLDTYWILTGYLLTYSAVGLTPVQTMELNGLSSKLRDLEKRFEQLVASRKHEDGRQLQLVELQRQVELIQVFQVRWR